LQRECGQRRGDGRKYEVEYEVEDEVVYEVVSGQNANVFHIVMQTEIECSVGLV